MSLVELKDMTTPELVSKLEELREKKFKLGFKHKTTMLDNPMEIRKIRKDIARIKTIMKEKRTFWRTTQQWLKILKKIFKCFNKNNSGI